MPIQENVATRLAYKLHTATQMTENTKLVPATDPAATGGQELRRVTSTLTLTKDTYQSDEINTARQVSDMRHGVERITGEITGELSPNTYFPFYEAAFRATKVATFSRSNTEFTSMAADVTTSKFTVAASTWAAQGFRVGDVIRFTGLSDVDNNSKNYLIYSLSTVDAFVTPAPDTMSADTSFTVDRIGTKISIPVTSHVKRLWAFEHFYQDIDETDLFTECRITGARWEAPATGLIRTTIPIMGRAQTQLSGASSPFFTSPTAAGTDGIAASVNGKVVFNGTVMGVLTGISMGLENAADAPAVVGQNFVPEILLGRSVVTGQLTALLNSASAVASAFANETEVEIYLMFTTTSAADSPFIAMSMPRVKLRSASRPLQGEAGILITADFQALLKPVTTGYDNTTMSLIDSVAT